MPEGFCPHTNTSTYPDIEAPIPRGGIGALFDYYKIETLPRPIRRVFTSSSVSTEELNCRRIITVRRILVGRG